MSGSSRGSLSRFIPFSTGRARLDAEEALFFANSRELRRALIRAEIEQLNWLGFLIDLADQRTDES